MMRCYEDKMMKMFPHLHRNDIFSPNKPIMVAEEGAWDIEKRVSKAVPDLNQIKDPFCPHTAEEDLKYLQNLLCTHGKQYLPSEGDLLEEMMKTLLRNYRNNMNRQGRLTLFIIAQPSLKILKERIRKQD